MTKRRPLRSMQDDLEQILLNQVTMMRTIFYLRTGRSVDDGHSDRELEMQQLAARIAESTEFVKRA